MFVYVLVFAPRYKRLLDQYRATGVETRGVVTHRETKIPESSSSSRRRRRRGGNRRHHHRHANATYRIRYARRRVSKIASSSRITVLSSGRGRLSTTVHSTFGFAGPTQLRVPQETDPAATTAREVLLFCSMARAPAVVGDVYSLVFHTGRVLGCV